MGGNGSAPTVPAAPGSGTGVAVTGGDPGSTVTDGGVPSGNPSDGSGPPPVASPPPPQFPWVTDYSSRPPSSVTLPAKFGSYVDPDFGSKIIRVTDASDGTSCVNAYSYWPAFNSDSTRLLIACDGVARLYRFDPATDTLTYDGPLATDGPQHLQYEGAFWSHDQPSVLYALAGMKLWRVDVSLQGAARFSPIRDFTGTFSYTFFPHQLGKSDDDNIFTWSSRTDQFGNTGGIDVVVYKRDTDQVFIFPRPSTFLPDESQMSKDGQHVIIPSRDGSGTWAIWTWSTGQVDLVAKNATTRPGGHYDGGRTKLVNANNWSTGFQLRDWTLPGSHAPQNIFTTFMTDGATLDWGVPDHVSMRADDESFVIMSTYGSTAGWQPFMREIILIRTDGSGFVRLGHTRGTRDDYFSEPRAVVDRRGRYIVYTSDLGSSTRLDALILKIPQQFAATTP